MLTLRSSRSARKAISKHPDGVPRDGSGSGLIRTIIGYAPANFVPALGTLATIVVFTRLLAPREFGYYAVAQACYAFCTTVVFGSLQLTIIRFSRAGQADEALWIGAAYQAYLLYAGLTAVVFVGGITIFISDPALKNILWVCLLATVLRGAVSVNVAIHRRRLHQFRYNVIECLQPFVAFAVALGLAVWGGMGSIALLWGMAASTLLAMLADARLMFGAKTMSDWPLLREMSRYGTPLGATYALASLSAYADRAFLLAFLGTTAVGIYGIGYNLVDRATSLIFISINIGVFPMALAAMEMKGVMAARRQMTHIGHILLSLGLPASVGLACCSTTAAYVLVGQDYRREVGYIIPWLCGASLIRGISSQFFEYSFHLGKRTDLAFRTLIPVACVNLALNAFLVPTLGIKGALTAGLLTQTIGLMLNALIGSRVFKLDFPFLYLLRATMALVPMAAILLLLPAYHHALGLIFKIGSGGVAYLVSGLLLGLWRRENVQKEPEPD